MILHLYSVMDKAVQAYMTPFFCRSDAEAMRSFADAVSNPEHQFNRHVSDYVLYRVGLFDDAEGMVVPCQEPQRIVAGSSLGGRGDEVPKRSSEREA